MEKYEAALTATEKQIVGKVILLMEPDADKVC
jgi:hypothetical protein